MPTSDYHNVPPILAVFEALTPRSVLDVGCGFGKFGVLLREYLDVWAQRVPKSAWQVRIDAVDAFEGYRNPIWDFVYDNVYIGDVRLLVDELPRYDAVLISDMIEHLAEGEAVRLVEALHRHADVVVISTPKEFYAQPSINGNEFEVHKCLWTESNYAPDFNVVKIPGLACNIFVSARRTLPRFSPAAPLDVVFLQSRQRLRRFGVAGWPLSAALRALARLIT